MYELFVLGQLMDKVMSGYRLKTILQRIVGNQRQISFGMIYPLLGKLATNKFINVHIVEDDLKRTKKIAEITDAGRDRFQALMREPVALNANTDFIYNVKFHNLHQLTISAQTDVLNAYIAYLSTRLTDSEQEITYIQTTDIYEAEFSDVKRVINLTEMQNKASLEWANRTLKEIQNDKK